MWYDDDHRLCIVNDVHFVKYVWEDVALWEIDVTAYKEEEITHEMRTEYAKFQQKL